MCCCSLSLMNGTRCSTASTPNTCASNEQGLHIRREDSAANGNNSTLVSVEELSLAQLHVQHVKTGLTATNNLHVTVWKCSHVDYKTYILFNIRCVNVVPSVHDFHSREHVLATLIAVDQIERKVHLAREPLVCDRCVVDSIRPASVFLREKSHQSRNCKINSHQCRQQLLLNETPVGERIRFVFLCQMAIENDVLKERVISRAQNTHNYLHLRLASTSSKVP